MWNWAELLPDMGGKNGNKMLPGDACINLWATNVFMDFSANMVAKLDNISATSTYLSCCSTMLPSLFKALNFLMNFFLITLKGMSKVAHHSNNLKKGRTEYFIFISKLNIVSKNNLDKQKIKALVSLGEPWVLYYSEVILKCQEVWALIFLKSIFFVESVHGRTTESGIWKWCIFNVE